MNAKKGYYCLIQFCPNPSRLEAVNVGVLLFCPDAEFIAARTTRGNRRAAKLVGQSSLNVQSLNAAKRAIERRLEVDREAFKSLEDLQRFVDTRANILKLTAPRPVKVFEPTGDLKSLFDELVGGAARRNAPQPIFAALDSAFHDLEQQGRARLNWDVTVPVAGVPLHIPYAYRNGFWNLVKPQRFSTQERAALRSALRLAIEGDLLFKHDADGQKKLVVVSSFEGEASNAQLENRVEQVFKEYNVKTVRSTDIALFVSEVQQDAH